MQGKRVAELAEKRRLWHEHLSRWESSGLSQVEYCRQDKLRSHIFLYWKKKLLVKSSAPALVLTVSKSSKRGAKSPLPPFTKLTITHTCSHRGDLEPGRMVELKDLICCGHT